MYLSRLNGVGILRLPYIRVLVVCVRLFWVLAMAPPAIPRLPIVQGESYLELSRWVVLVLLLRVVVSWV